MKKKYPLVNISDLQKHLKEFTDRETQLLSIWKEDQQLIQKKLKVFFDALITGPNSEEDQKHK